MKDCHSPKYIKVGKSYVYICGLYDLSSTTLKEINKLDIFFGLDRSWHKHLQIVYTNYFCKEFQKNILFKNIHNLFVYHIPDRSIDEDFAYEVIKKFTCGWKIGFGCMGTHGRSGWLLGKLIKKIERLNGKKLLEQVRKRLCKNAVESFDQFESLGIEDLYRQEIKYVIPKEFFPELVFNNATGRWTTKPEQKGGDTDERSKVDVPIV